MKSYAEVNEVIKTLPTGIYLGARIEYELDPNCPASFYDPIKFRIIISYPMIAEMATDETLEEDLRCLLYHEISHAMLTPNDLYRMFADTYYTVAYSKVRQAMSNDPKLTQDIADGKYPNASCAEDILRQAFAWFFTDQEMNHGLINIFEDQRIETLNKDVFLKVDFPSFVKKFNKYDPNNCPINNFRDFFYRVVRFNDIEPDLIRMLYDIIYSRESVTTNSSSNASGRFAGMFFDFLYACYHVYMNKYATQPAQSQPQQQQNQQKSNGTGQDASGDKESDEDNLDDNYDDDDEDEEDGNEQVKEMLDKVKQQSQSNQNSDNGLDMNQAGENGEESNQQNQANQTQSQEASSGAGSQVLSEQDVKDIVKKALEDNGYKGQALEDAVNQVTDMIKEEITKRVLNKYNCTPKFSTMAEGYIMRMLKKKSTEAKSLAGYSGRINPKNVHRPGRVETYRWFDKANPNGLNATAGKFRINFFCDNSGSFDSNREVANSIIRTLWMLSKKHKAFEFTLVTHGNRHVVRNDNNMAIECNEGTDIYPEIFQIYNSLQKQGQTIWNFVLFDGGVNCKESRPLYKVWNHQNVIMICDKDDQQYIEKYCPKAKKIFTNWYCEKLEENILTCMDQMFR